MRINKYIAQCSSASRRKADEYILEGCVKLNGEVVAEPGAQVYEGDRVLLNGVELIPKSADITIAHNKPVGFLCSKGDPHGRPTVYDLLPAEYQMLKYIGRLDMNSHGLLLFSNDGKLNHRLTHPSFDIPRCYHVILDNAFSEAAAKQLRSGVLIGENEQTRPAEVKFEGKNVDITLREGRKREIRRMMSVLGYEVIDLKRVSYGPVELRDLEERKCRVLSTIELRELYEMVQLHR